MTDYKIKENNQKIDLKNSKNFDSIFETFYPRAYSFTLSLLNDEMASADIAQEAFLYMWKKAFTFPNELAFKSYLYNCLKNKVLNYIRDHKKESDMQGLKDILEDKVSLDHLVIKHELRSRIIEEVKKLPKVKQSIILLHLEGYSYDEISEKLGLSINTVKTHKKQAYKDLRIPLEEYKQCFLIIMLILATSLI